MTKFGFNQAVPFEATHVGEVIKDELAARNMKQTIQGNYNQIKEDVKQIVKDELGRIANDENLKHLIQKA